jgi:DNA mismatch repair protein MutS2
MDSSVLHTLEFNKIRAMLAAATGSSLGREIAESLEPVSDSGEVEWRLAETQEAFDLLAAAAIVPLGGIRDIREMLQRAERGAILEPPDFVAVGSTLYAARRLKQFFAELNAPVPHLAETAAAITAFRNIENAIADTIGDQGAVLDTASPELARIRREIRVTQSRVKEKLDHIVHSGEYQKYLQDAIVTIRGDRYVIPVKQEYRHAFPGIVHDQSASGATVFIEPMAVVNLNNDLKQLMSAELNEIERILRHLTAQVAGAAGTLARRHEHMLQAREACGSQTPTGVLPPYHAGVAVVMRAVHTTPGPEASCGISRRSSAPRRPTRPRPKRI